jgi:hypothetical protein
MVLDYFGLIYVTFQAPLPLDGVAGVFVIRWSHVRAETSLSHGKRSLFTLLHKCETFEAL